MFQASSPFFSLTNNSSYLFENESETGWKKFKKLAPKIGVTRGALCVDQFETSTSPPRAYPGHLTVHRARGGGNLNVALEGWGI